MSHKAISPDTGTSSNRSLLVDCPNEIFFRICQNIHYMDDFANLALVPILKTRLKHFVRLVTEWPQLYFIPSALRGFPRFSFDTPAPNYSINLCETNQFSVVDQLNDMFRDVKSRSHVHNIIYVFDINTLSSYQIARTYKPKFDELNDIFDDPSCFIVSGRSAVTINAFEVKPEQFQAPFLQELVYDGKGGVFPWLKPRKVKIYGDVPWDSGYVNFDCVEDLIAHYEMRHGSHTGHELGQRMKVSGVTASCLKTIELNQVTVIRGLDLPVVETFDLTLTSASDARRNNTAELFRPHVSNINAPLCKQFRVTVDTETWLDSDLETPIHIHPEVLQLSFPSLTEFSLNYRAKVVQDDIKNLRILHDSGVVLHGNPSQELIGWPSAESIQISGPPIWPTFLIGCSKVKELILIMKLGPTHRCRTLGTMKNLERLELHETSEDVRSPYEKSNSFGTVSNFSDFIKAPNLITLKWAQDVKHNLITLTQEDLLKMPHLKHLEPICLLKYI